MKPARVEHCRSGGDAWSRVVIDCATPEEAEEVRALVAGIDALKECVAQLEARIAAMSAAATARRRKK